MFDRIIVGSVVGGVATLLVACSSEKASPAPAANSSPPAASQQNSNVRAYVDPTTGQLREPTAEEQAQEAAAQKARSQQKTSPGAATTPQEILLPSGAVEMSIDQSKQHPLRACIESNGAEKVDHECNASGANR